MRKLSAAVLLLVLLSGAIVAAMLLLLPRQVANQAAVRRVDQAVLWGGGEVDVTPTLTPALVTSCPQATRPLDIALLIDTSNSMQGQPLHQAVAS